MRAKKKKEDIWTNSAYGDTSDYITSLFCQQTSEPCSLSDTRCSKLPKQERFPCQDLYSDTPLILFWRQKTTRQPFAVPSQRSYPHSKSRQHPKYCLHSAGPRTKFECQMWGDGCIFWLPDKKWKALAGLIPTQTPETGWEHEWWSD